MRTRSLELEVLDDPNVPPEELLAALNFMAWVNRRLGGTQAILDFFEKNPTPQEFSVLDLGFGAGDIPYALVEWAKSKGKKVSVTAIDLNPFCVAHAVKNYTAPGLRFMEHSAFDIETLGSFDYMTSSMFFHHLPDEQIVQLLQRMDKNARRGFIVNDLYRGYLNYAGAFLLGALSFRRIIFNDAKLSVKRAFKEQNLEHYRDKSGLKNLKIERKPVFRITLSCHCERSEAIYA